MEPTHVRRLRLIRALAQVGDLPLESIAEILRAIDDNELSVHRAIGVAHYALARRGATNAGSPELDEVKTQVDRFIDDRWTVDAAAPDRDELASALLTLQRLGWQVDTRVFERYAKAADRIASWELSRVPDGVERERAVENAVVGTVVLEAVFAALRRLAEEHHSAIRFGG